MIRIYGENGQVAGELSEEQFAFLQAQLEEEHGEDQDYFLNEGTVAMLEEAGADPHLTAVLRAAVGTAGGGEVRWTRE